MMKKNVLTIVLLLAGYLLYAQGEDRTQWNLQQCIDHALSNSLDVKRGVLAVEGSAVDYNDSKFSMLPNLNGQSSFGSRLGRSIDPTSNLFVSRNIQSFNVSGSSSVLLWNGFRLQNNMRSYGTQKTATDKDLERTKNDVALNVASLFLQVVLNQEQLANAQSQLASTGQQLARTRKLSEAGSIPRSEVLNLEAQEATNELNVTQRQNAVDFSLLQLKQALQVPSSRPFEIVAPEINIESEMLIGETVGQVYDQALETMPEVDAARSRIESAEYAARAARGYLYPSLNVNGNVFSNYSSAASQGLGEDYPFSDQLNDNVSKSVSVGLSVPIFNGFSARSNIQRAVINNERARIDGQEVENQLRQSVETAYNDTQAALKTYQSASKQVQARDEAFRMIKQRYEIGAANFVEYQIAENDLFQAQSDLVRAKYDFIFRKKVLDFYMGKPITL